MTRIITVTCAVAMLLLVEPASARELTLAEALAKSEQNSPALRAASLKERAAHEGVGAARSKYYPAVETQALESWGFPASSSWLGAPGLLGSNRFDKVAGVVAKDTIFDFGRTYASVKNAKTSEKAAHEEIALDKFGIDADVLQTYYECARFRSEHEVWDGLHGETELVAREVARFVNTGQRSIVDRYLSQAQVEEARTNRNFFNSRMNSTVGRLALLMGSREKELTCPALPALGEGVPLYPTGAVNPYVLRARTEVELAQSRLLGARTEYLPKIVGVASVGGVDDGHLVERQSYAGALGVSLPLFDGLGTVHRVAQAREELAAKRQSEADVELRMDELNSRYDEVIEASQARIEHLEQEMKLAQEGFDVAKNRYFKFQGTLVDLRDALRNLGRIQTDLKDTQANLLEAIGAKVLLNGASAAKPEERKP